MERIQNLIRAFFASKPSDESDARAEAGRCHGLVGAFASRRNLERFAIDGFTTPGQRRPLHEIICVSPTHNDDIPLSCFAHTC
jgi:hypothetical protein